MPLDKIEEWEGDQMIGCLCWRRHQGHALRVLCNLDPAGPGRTATASDLPTEAAMKLSLCLAAIMPRKSPAEAGQELSLGGKSTST
jgi:hypothetical protein